MLKKNANHLLTMKNCQKLSICKIKQTRTKKSTISEKHSQAKYSKTRCACIWFKKKQWTQSGINCAKPLVSKDDLIAIIASQRNETFNQSVWNFLAYIKEAIHLTDPCLHPKEVILPEIILSSIYDFLIPIIFCLLKPFLFCYSLELLFPR